MCVYVHTCMRIWGNKTNYMQWEYEDIMRIWWDIHKIITWICLNIDDLQVMYIETWGTWWYLIDKGFGSSDTRCVLNDVVMPCDTIASVVRNNWVFTQTPHDPNRLKGVGFNRFGMQCEHQVFLSMLHFQKAIT